MPMTAQQRSDAARKAAATKRARRMGFAGAPHTHHAPPPPPTPSWNTTTPPVAPPPPARTYATPKASAATLRLVALTAIEDLFIVQQAENGITDEARTAFKTYKRLLTHALGPINAQATANQQAGTQNEQANAFRLAVIQLVKFAF